MIIVFSLFGCANNNTNTENNQGGTNTTDTGENGGNTIGDTNGTTDTTPTDEGVAFNDGEYTAQGDKWEHGQEEATVLITEGRIAEVTLRRLDTSGNEVDYDEWTGEEKDGRTYPNLKQIRIDMANEMVEKQTYDVDTVSGATVSAENWKVAAQRALDQAAQ